MPPRQGSLLHYLIDVSQGPGRSHGRCSINICELMKYALPLLDLTWLPHKLIRKIIIFYSKIIRNILIEYKVIIFIQHVQQTQTDPCYIIPIAILCSYQSSQLREGIFSPGKWGLSVELVIIQLSILET